MAVSRRQECLAHKRLYKAYHCRDSSSSMSVYGVACAMSCMPHSARMTVHYLGEHNMCPPHALHVQISLGALLGSPLHAFPPSISWQGPRHEMLNGNAGRNLLSSADISTARFPTAFPTAATTGSWQLSCGSPTTTIVIRQEA